MAATSHNDAKTRSSWLWIGNACFAAASAVWIFLDQGGPFGDAAKWYFAALAFAGIKGVLGVITG